MKSARAFAMTRMEEAADQVGADGINPSWVSRSTPPSGGADVYKGHRDLALPSSTSAGMLHRATQSGRPVTSDLRGQDFWALIRCGHRSRWYAQLRPPPRAPQQLRAGKPQDATQCRDGELHAGSLDVRAEAHLRTARMTRNSRPKGSRGQ